MRGARASGGRRLFDSGKDTQRPQLDALLSFARNGDTVVVHSMTIWRATCTVCAGWCRR